MSGEWLTPVAHALNGLAAAATPYLVGAWLVASLVGASYSYTLLRKARRDQAYQWRRGTILEYSAESTVGRVWIRTKTFVEFCVIGACATLLLVPATEPLLLLVRAVARLLYLGLFLSVIAQLAYNAWRDDRRDTHLRRLLNAQDRERQAALDAVHTLRRTLADERQPAGATPPAERLREAEERTAP